AVLAVAEIGLAEEPTHIQAAIGADLPRMCAVARCFIAKADLGPAVIAGDSDEAACDSIFGTDGRAHAADFEGRIGVASRHIVLEGVTEHVQPQSVRSAAAAVKVGSARQG